MQFFIYCNKENPQVIISSFDPPVEGPGGIVYVRGKGFGTTIADVTVRFGNAYGEVKSVSDSLLTVVVPEAAEYGAITVHSRLGTASSESAFRLIKLGGRWEKMAAFAGQPRSGAIGFSIGDKGYIGLGAGTGEFNDLYEYDPNVNAWAQKASLPGPGRSGSVALMIEGRAFVIGGISQGTPLKEVWQYDQPSNSWTRKADFPDARFNALGFVFQNIAYVGMGQRKDLAGQESDLSDWWVYSPIPDLWTFKIEFPGSARSLATVLVSDDEVYVGIGISGQTAQKDFWEFDPGKNEWEKVKDFEGGARYGASGFCIGNGCYIGNGIDGSGDINRPHNDWWIFSPYGGAYGYYDGGNRVNAQTVERYAPVSFVINGIGYLGTGYNVLQGPLGDFWRFLPPH